MLINLHNLNDAEIHTLYNFLYKLKRSLKKVFVIFYECFKNNAFLLTTICYFFSQKNILCYWHSEWGSKRNMRTEDFS